MTAGAGNGNVFCRGTATGLKRSVNPAGAGWASGVAPVKHASDPLVRHRDVTDDLRRAPGAVCRLVLGGSRRQLAKLRDECTLCGVEAGKNGSGAIDRHRALQDYCRLQISDSDFRCHPGRLPIVLQIPVECCRATVEYHISQYELEQGALEIQYIEEFFGEFPRKKTASEIVRRLRGRAHLILLANAPLPDDPGSVVPVSFKVAHEIRSGETEPKLADLVNRLRDYVRFNGRRVLYTWVGGTRRDWRGQGHFRALTEQQELWAVQQGFDEIVVKTKNKFYDMRGTLDHLRFEVVKYERNEADNTESKVYLSKKLLPEVLDEHRSARTVVQVPV